MKGGIVLFERGKESPRWRWAIIPVVLLAVSLLVVGGCATATPTATPVPKASAAPIAFSQGGRIALRLGSGETVFLTAGPIDVMPSVSPDGTKVAFVAVGAADRKGTYVVNIDGSGEHQVAPSVAILSRPAWSPNSRQLALRDTTKDQMGIWTVDADGKNRQRSVITVEVSTPAWSPDGKFIAFASGNSTKDGTVKKGVYVTDPEGKAPHLVAEGQYGELAWSPDGKRLAVVAAPKDAPRALLSVELAGGQPITMTTNLAEASFAPAWSPDGKSIALVVTHEDGQHLATIPAAGGPLNMLVHGKSFSTPVWSAGGDSLLTSRDVEGKGISKLLWVSTKDSSSLEELGPGDSPCALPGSPSKPVAAVAARPLGEGMRRAELIFVSGGWG